MAKRMSQLTVGYCPTWKKQNAWDTPLANGDLTKAFPATSRNYIELDDDTEDIYDCTGEDFLFEVLVGRRARLTLDFDVDPDILAGLEAFAKGVAAAPSGGTNEVQSEAMTGTGGSRTLTVQVGADQQTTTAIAFDADAATIQAALEALSNVAVNDIVVSGTGPFVYTFSGTAFQKQDVNLIVSEGHLLTGGTSVFTTTTPGVGLLHTITRLVAYTLPLMTFYIGFRGSSFQPVIFKNVVVDSIRVRATHRGKVTATVVLVGSADLVEASGYTMPPCQDIVPIRFGDCQMIVGGYDYIANNLGREFEYYYQNNVNPIFDGAGLYSTRHERADRRPCGFNFFMLGEPGDTLFNLAKNRTSLDASLRLGPTGRNMKVLVPSGLIKLAPQQIRGGGDPLEAEIGVVVRPKKVSGNANTPMYSTANIGLSATLLTSA